MPDTGGLWRVRHGSCPQGVNRQRGRVVSPSHHICPYDMKRKQTTAQRNSGISEEAEVTNTNWMEFFLYNKCNSIRDVYPDIGNGQSWFSVDAL